MTVSSIRSNTSSVIGDAVVVLATVDVLTLLRRLLVGEREVGPTTAAELAIVLIEAVFESPSLSVAGVGDVSSLPAVGLSVTPSVIAEVLVSDEYLVEIDVLETKLIGVEASSEVSVVTAALDVAATSSEIAVVFAALVVDLSSVVLLLGVVSASSEDSVSNSALVGEESSVGGSVRLLGEV